MGGSLQFQMLLLIYFAVIINQALLIFATFLLLQKKKRRYKGLKVSMAMILKSAILVISFYIAIHFIRDKIIIPLVLYVLHLIALGMSLQIKEATSK